jgi:hypothetical protein
MSINNSNIPEDLMKNVECKLRKYVKNKKKKLHLYASVAVLIIAVMLPVSVIAYSKYYDNIPFKQEIDLARQNNNVSKLNKSFKYKNIDFTIKEIVADETGIEVIYNVSNPKYYIDGLSFKDADNKSFHLWGYSLPDSGGSNSDKKEKALFIFIGKDEAKYIQKNPITISIDKISYKNTEYNNKILSKISSFINPKNDSFKVNWNLKTQITMQNVKNISINKEYNLNIGTLKLKNLKKGILKTILEYDFTPSDRNIAEMRPLFSIRLDNNYTDNINEEERPDYKSGYIHGEEFKSIYYKNIKEIGIRLVGSSVNYWYDKEYEISKDKLPMQFDFNGEKFNIVSMSQKDGCTEYKVEYDKTNRIYERIGITGARFSDTDSYGFEFHYKNAKVQFKDQSSRDTIYNTLIKKVPNLNSIYNNAGYSGIGVGNAVVSENFIFKGRSINNKFKIESAARSFLYDTDEIVIKP